MTSTEVLIGLVVSLPLNIGKSLHRTYIKRKWLPPLPPWLNLSTSTHFYPLLVLFPHHQTVYVDGWDMNLILGDLAYLQQLLHLHHCGACRLHHGLIEVASSLPVGVMGGWRVSVLSGIVEAG